MWAQIPKSESYLSCLPTVSLLSNNHLGPLSILPVPLALGLLGIFHVLLQEGSWEEHLNIISSM